MEVIVKAMPEVRFSLSPLHEVTTDAVPYQAVCKAHRLRRDSRLKRAIEKYILQVFGVAG